MRRKTVTKRIKRGFTLVELLVVIVILAMLTGLVAPKFFTQIEDANYRACRPKMALLESAIETYLINVGSYPESLEDLLYDPGVNGWVGPYVEEELLYDPWERQFYYESYGSGYDIISFAADGAEGGEGKYDVDIYN